MSRTSKVMRVVAACFITLCICILVGICAASVMMLVPMWVLDVMAVALVGGLGFFMVYLCVYESLGG